MQFSESIKRNDFLVTTHLESCCPDDAFDAIKTANFFSSFINGMLISDELQFNSKIGSIAICHLLKDSGIDPIVHIACSGKTKKLLEAFLMTSWMLGIKNLCITSEKVSIKKSKSETSETKEVNALQLINLIHRLKEGKDFSNKNIREKPSFTVGTLLNLENGNSESCGETIKQKIEAGIEFIITTPIYSIRQIENLIQYTEGKGVKIIAGVMPVLSVEAARRVNHSQHEKPITSEIIERLGKAKNSIMEGIHIASELVKEIKNKVNGIHLVASEKIIPKVLKESSISQIPSLSLMKEENDFQKLNQIFEGKLSIKELEKAYIIRVLKNNRGNRSAAAEVLGIHRNTLMRKCQEFEINI